MRVLIFSTTFVWNISHSKKKWARYDQKSVLVFRQSTRYYCQVLLYLGQCFGKYWSTKFHYNTSSDSRVVPCGRTDERKDGRADKRWIHGMISQHNLHCVRTYRPNGRWCWQYVSPKRLYPSRNYILSHFSGLSSTVKLFMELVSRLVS